MAAPSAWSGQVEETVPARPRLDYWLAQRHPALSRTQIQRLIRSQQVSVDGRAARASVRLQPGQTVTLARTELPRAEPLPSYPLALDVLYEDAALAIVNKPAGLVMHPAPGHPQRTLANAVMHRWPDLQGNPDRTRPGIVHRLDKDTSGLVVIAKTHRTLHALQDQFKQRRVRKTYLTLVDGFLEPRAGAIDVPLGRHPRHRQRQAAFPAEDGAVRPGARPARSLYRVTRYLQRLAPSGTRPFSLVEVEPETGRTHQIRVHMAYLGHPVVGDATYGLRKPRLALSRHFLHAAGLAFQHPVRGQSMQFRSSLPNDLAACVRALTEAR